MSDQKQESEAKEQQEGEQQQQAQQNAQPEQTQATQVTTSETVTIDVPTSNDQQQTRPESSRFNEAMSKFSRGLMDRHIRYDPLSIVFTLIILVGGILGFALKGSIPSLVSGILFAILLGLGTYIEGVRKNSYPFLVVLVILGGMMTYRYYESNKFLPTGLFATLTLVMIARHAYLIYLRNNQN